MSSLSKLGGEKMDSGHDNKRTIVEEDRLSSLPDDLIHRILSFMDIKYAVQTSSLSSRWKLIWTKMPYLNFSTQYFSTLPKFSKFVGHVLSCRNNQVEAYSVDLHFHGKYGNKFVSRIIDYAFTHNVQEFTLSCSDKKQIPFPPFLFSSRILKHLYLNTFFNEHCNTPTSPWDLPALTSLHLHHVTLSDDNTDKHLGLFSKCVNLEDLSLNGCTLLGSDVFSICAPKLTHLTLTDEVRTPGVVKVVASKLKNLHLFNCLGKYQIKAPMLSSLYCGAICPLQLSLDSCHSLEKVDLVLYGTQHNEEDTRRIVDLFQEVRGAKFLTLNLAILECLSSYPHLLLNHPSPFGSLKCLKISQKGWEFNRATLSTEISHHLVDNSPSATVIVDLLEENQPEKSRKELLQETRAWKKANLETVDIMLVDLQILAEQCRAQIEPGTESPKAELQLQLQELEQVKAQIEKLRKEIYLTPTPVESYMVKMRARVGQRLAELQSYLGELKAQFDRRNTDTGSQQHH